MTWYELTIQLLITVAAVIPLSVAVIRFARKSVQEKNWTNLVKLVFDLCVQAEEEIMTGADRKEWVLSMLEKTASTVGYDLYDDEVAQKVNDLIDSFIDATKQINVSTSKNELSEYEQLEFMLDEN